MAFHFYVAHNVQTKILFPQAKYFFPRLYIFQGQNHPLPSFPGPPFHLILGFYANHPRVLLDLSMWKALRLMGSNTWNVTSLRNQIPILIVRTWVWLQSFLLLLEDPWLLWFCIFFYLEAFGWDSLFWSSNDWLDGQPKMWQKMMNLFTSFLVMI